MPTIPGTPVGSLPQFYLSQNDTKDLAVMAVLGMCGCLSLIPDARQKYQSLQECWTKTCSECHILIQYLLTGSFPVSTIPFSLVLALIPLVWLCPNSYAHLNGSPLNVSMTVTKKHIDCFKRTNISEI